MLIKITKTMIIVFGLFTLSSCRSAVQPEDAPVDTAPEVYRSVNTDNYTVVDATGTYSVSDGNIFYDGELFEGLRNPPLQGTELSKVGVYLYYMTEDQVIIKIDTRSANLSTSLGLDSVSHFAAGLSKIYYFVEDSGYYMSEQGNKGKIPDKTDGIFLLHSNQLIYTSGQNLINISLLDGRIECYSGEVKSYTLIGDTYRFILGDKVVDIK